MSKGAKSKLLVIDASIARAAGMPGSDAACATACREFLQAVRRICHRAAMSGEIAAEWRRHRSRFARSWLTSMYARKKALHITPGQSNAIRAAIAVVRSDRDKEILLKDVHLLDAALCNDRIVASLDSEAQKLFQKISFKVRELHDLMWVDPNNSAPDVLAWLQGGAQPCDRYFLGRRSERAAKT